MMDIPLFLVGLGLTANSIGLMVVAWHIDGLKKRLAHHEDLSAEQGHGELV